MAIGFVSAGLMGLPQLILWHNISGAILANLYNRWVEKDAVESAAGTEAEA